MSVPVDDLGPQRAVDRQFLEGKDGAQIGEAAQRRAQSEQTGLGALACGKRIELVVAHRAQENSLGVESGGNGIGRQGRSILLNGHAANALVIQFQRVTAGGRNFLQDSDGFRGDFGADAVSGGNENFQLHS